MGINQFLAEVFKNTPLVGGVEVQREEVNNVFDFKVPDSSVCNKDFYENIFSKYYNNKENIEYISEVFAKETPDDIPDFKFECKLIKGDLEFYMQDKHVLSCDTLNNKPLNEFMKSISVLGRIK